MIRMRSTAGTFLALAVMLTLATSGCRQQPDLPYSALVSEVKADNVNEIVIKQDVAVVTFKQPPAGGDPAKREFTVIIPPGDEAQIEFFSMLDDHHVTYQITN